MQSEPRGIAIGVPQGDGISVEGDITDSFRREKVLAYIKAMYAKADALYEDTIVNAVGQKVFEDLKYYGLIESCGNIGGRRLYAM